MSDSIAPTVSRAVFLSYAHEDALAARRIAEALRAVGIEVWFDQSELRGGDAWDQAIRKQIKDCALFIPIVSANTQDRGEGYFRLEWKLAVERTHQMAEGIPFLTPVALDRSHEADALVPSEFLRVHWTRLANGEPTQEFVGQIKRILDAPRKSTAMRKAESAGSKFVEAPAATAASAPSLPTAPPASAPMAAPPVQVAARPTAKSRASLWFTLGLVGIALAVIVYVALRPAAKKSSAIPEIKSSAPPVVSETSAAADKPAAADKSIAVLPFANRSPDKENEFFTDGVHEDILTNLGNIHELRVVSNTSVAQYRGTTKSMKQIGAELNVAYILEGSVQRVGNKVHVTGQLIDARTDTHLWAKAYDKDLTDIFVIQAELAKAIAAELQSVLSPQEQRLIERRPTVNIAAYELVLKSREWTNRPTATRQDLDESRLLLQKAVQLDPGYAAAYADLAHNYVFSGRYGTFARAENVQRAKEALDIATRLAPNSPEVFRASGDYYYYGFGDFDHALEQYEKLRQLRPNDPVYYNRVGSIQRRQSRWLEALASLRKLEEIDPGMLRNRRDIALLLAAGRRFDEAIAQQRRVVERAPDDLQTRYELADLSYVASGSTQEMEHFLAGLTSEQASSDLGIRLRKSWALRRDDFAEVLRLDKLRPARGDFDLALVLAAHGDANGARTELIDLAAELGTKLKNKQPVFGDFAAWRDLGLAEALSGHREEALRCAKKAAELMPVSRDALMGGETRSYLALVYAWVGDKEAAIAEYQRLFRLPYGISGNAGSFPRASIHTMRLDPIYAPLHGDPRWETLLNDPKNNAPLF